MYSLTNGLLDFAQLTGIVETPNDDVDVSLFFTHSFYLSERSISVRTKKKSFVAAKFTSTFSLHKYSLKIIFKTDFCH